MRCYCEKKIPYLYHVWDCVMEDFVDRHGYYHIDASRAVWAVHTIELWWSVVVTTKRK